MSERRCYDGVESDSSQKGRDCLLSGRISMACITTGETAAPKLVLDSNVSGNSNAAAGLAAALAWRTRGSRAYTARPLGLVQSRQDCRLRPPQGAFEGYTPPPRSRPSGCVMAEGPRRRWAHFHKHAHTHTVSDTHTHYR